MTLLTRIAALIVCAPALLTASESYPEFNWERVPLYAHLGIGDGLKSDQIEFLADHFKLIAFTGGNTKKSVETNIASAAAAIKQRNPKTKVLFYWSSDIPKHQWAHSISTFPEGGYLQAKKNGKDSKQFDVRRTDVRDWWSSVAGKAVHEYNCDGIFIDGLTAGATNQTWSMMFGAKQAAEMDQGVFAMLKQAREKMGPGKLIVFNPLHGYDAKRPGLGEQYLPETDGAMVSVASRSGRFS